MCWWNKSLSLYLHYISFFFFAVALLRWLICSLICLDVKFIGLDRHCHNLTMLLFVWHISTMQSSWGDGRTINLGLPLPPSIFHDMSFRMHWSGAAPEFQCLSPSVSQDDSEIIRYSRWKLFVMVCHFWYISTPQQASELMSGDVRGRMSRVMEAGRSCRARVRDVRIQSDHKYLCLG